MDYPKVVEEFKKAMKDAERNLRVENFDADHAFANPSDPSFNKTATDTAHKSAIQFFRKNLIR
jgi:carboxymethylenebutenolidase